MSSLTTNAREPMPVTAFRNKVRDYDAKAIAQYLGLKVAQVARILGADPSTLSRNPAAPKIRSRAAKLERVINLLTELYGDTDYSVAWLKTPSELWDEKGERTAFDLMASEDWGLDFVLQTVEAMRRGDPLT